MALARVCDFMGWAGAHAFVLNEATGLLESSDLWYAPAAEQLAALRDVSGSAPLGRGVGLPGRVLALGRPAWISDISEDPDFPRATAALAAGVRSAFAFPVSVEGRVAAVLEFFATEPTEPDAPLLEMMATIGANVGGVFERMRAHEAVAESGARFEALAHNASDAIVTIDQDDRILYANPATGRLFGYETERLRQGMHFSELMPERFRARHREGLRRYVRTHERRIPWNGVELPGRHCDGREIPLEITFGVFERQGRHFFTGIMRDASERRRVEAERRVVLERERRARTAAEEARREAEWRARQERALREAAAAVASGFTVEDTAQRIASSSLDATQAEGAFVQQLDAASQEIVVVAAEGGRVPAVGRRVSFEGSLTQQAIERGSPLLLGRLDEMSARVRHELPNGCGGCSAAVIPLLVDEQAVGSLILLREQGRVFQDDDSARAGIFGELASLAFHKIQLLADIEHRHEELRRVVESRALLIRGFSHDVKNPIGTADGYLQLLQDDVYGGGLEAGQREALDRARRALGSALTLIRDLLELARAEAGQIEIRPTDMDVGEAIAETVLEYRAQAERAGLEMSVEPPEPVPTIVSDPTRVRQIVGNILSNAVKYTTPPGRVAVRIIASERGPRPNPTGWIGVQVADTGAGIPEEQRDRLFEEFFRLDPNGSEGAGIGLAISRRLAHALGGDITVKSEVGAGSTFTLWLPRTAPPAAERPD